MSDLIRVKDKFQVTLLASIRQQLAVHEGDYLEVSVLDDGIVFRPQQTARRASKGPSLTRFLNEHRSTTRSREDIDTTLASDRDSWGQQQRQSSATRWCISTPMC
jgi:AbrB family looped-hinge helix DNA binding protein